MAFQGGVAGEGAVALAADVAAHARVDLHVLLERALCLETLPAQKTEDSHVRACREMGQSLSWAGARASGGTAPPAPRSAANPEAAWAT